MSKTLPAWAATKRGYRIKSEHELRDEGFCIDAYGRLTHKEGMTVERAGLGLPVHLTDEGYVSDEGYFVDLQSAIWLVVKEYLH